MKTIEVTISLDGRTSIQTTGFQGTSCQDASRFLECALGDRISEQLTSEYHSATAVNRQHHQHGV